MSVFEQYPLPWKLSESGLIRSADNKSILPYQRHDLSTAIVEAVNSHAAQQQRIAELEALLKDAEPYLFNSPFENSLVVHERIQEALGWNK